MTAIIEITNGTYKIRGNDTSMNGYRFELVDQFKTGANGGFVTVKGGSVVPPNAGIPNRDIRIKCESANDYTIKSLHASTDRIGLGPRGRYQLIGPCYWSQARL